MCGDEARFSLPSLPLLPVGGRGIAHSLALARQFTGEDRIVVLLADNIFEYSISPYVQEFRNQAQGARVLPKEVGDLDRYGIAALDQKQIFQIEEKPSQPKSKPCLVDRALSKISAVSPFVLS